jgi:Domain of unknown function (DUF4397)
MPIRVWKRFIYIVFLDVVRRGGRIMRSISDMLVAVRALVGKFLFAAISCLVFCVGFAGLLPMQTALAATTPAYVRVIHASPFVGTADVFVDGQSLLTSFEFASVTDYVPVPAGTHKIQIAVVGKGINAAVLTQDLTVEEGKVYTIAALGTSANALSLQAFEDDNQLSPSQARVRVYQLSPDGGSLNVSVGGDSSVTDMMAYPTASDYLNTDAGPCTFSLINSHSQLAPLTVNLGTQDITSIFVVGMFNGTPQAQFVYKQSAGVPGMPSTGNDPSPIADIVQPLSPLSLSLIGGVLVLSLIALRKWRQGGFKRTKTV